MKVIREDSNKKRKKKKGELGYFTTMVGASPEDEAEFFNKSVDANSTTSDAQSANGVE